MFQNWVCTFFICLEGVAPKLFTEIHHTLSRDKPMSAIYNLATSKQTQYIPRRISCIHQNNQG